MSLRNLYNGAKGFVSRNKNKLLGGGIILVSTLGAGYLLHKRFESISNQVVPYAQSYRESGRTSLEHDVECVDAKGREVEVNKSWRKPDEVNYLQVHLDKGRTYVCRAANPHANPQEKVLWVKLAQVLDVSGKEYIHILSGQQYDPATGELRFNFSDYGKYRVQLGVSTFDTRGRKWQTPEMRTLEFLVSKPQEKKKVTKTNGNGRPKNGNGKKTNEPVKTSQPDAQVREEEPSEGYDFPDIGL